MSVQSFILKIPFAFWLETEYCYRENVKYFNMRCIHSYTVYKFTNVALVISWPLNVKRNLGIKSN